MAVIENIEHLIPQKFPFVMVDKLLEFSANKLSSSFLIEKNNLFVDRGKLLESGLIENMAQTVALHTGYEYFVKGKPAPTGYIGAIKKSEIISLPNVNDCITTTIEVVQEFDGVSLVDVSVCSNNQIIATSQLKTVIATDA